MRPQPVAAAACATALLCAFAAPAAALDARGAQAAVDRFLGAQSFQDNATAQAGEHAVADVDGDGRPDVVLMWTVLGATWWQPKLTLLLDQGRSYRALTTDLSGQTQKLTVKGSDIVVDTLMPGPDDPRCCPTRKAKMRFRWQGGRLVLLK